jgi:putative peptidoglycan lipid II flippase
MLRSTRMVVLLGLAVQIAAFLRTAIIAAALGTSPDVDAYNLGLIAPTFLSTVIGSWLQLSFVGRYTSLVTTEQSDLAAAYRARMLTLILAGALLLAALCFLFPAPIMSLFMPAGQTAMIAHAAAALRLSGLILIPILLGDFLGLILNSHGRFFAAALSPFLNAMVSVAGLWFWHSLNLQALVCTLLLGSFAQCLVVLLALSRLRLGFPLRTDAAKGEVWTTLALAIPLLPATMLANSTAAIVQFRAAELGEGAVAIYGYASRLHGALAQVLVIGLGTVLLPHFAALWSRGATAEIVTVFRRLARAIVLLAAYLGVGIYLMGNTATRVLFERGAFDAQHSAQAAWLWALLSLSLFPFAFGTYIAKFCQSVRGAGSILASGVISFAVTWCTAWLGASFGSLDIITGAAAASATAVTCFWLVWLALRIPATPILGDIAAAALRIGLILIPAILIERWFNTLAQDWNILLNLLLRGLSYSAVILSLLLVTRSWQWFLSSAPGANTAQG